MKFDQIEAILFDMDGTLIDTDDAAVSRLAGRIRPFLGHHAPQLARWLLMKAETPGNLLITFLDWLHLDEPLMSLTDWLRKHRGAAPAHDFHLIPGVETAVLSLAQKYRIGIVTTRSRYHIDRFLIQFPKLAQIVEVSCGLQDTRRLKPHPAPIKLAAQRLRLSPDVCLMVGDTTVDVKSARRAGAWSVGVLCGFGEKEELERAGAHLILSSTADLPDHL